MKLGGQQISFHRPEFLKRNDNQKAASDQAQNGTPRPSEIDLSNKQARNSALKQLDRASRTRLFGGLVTVSRVTAPAAVPLPISMWATGQLSDQELRNHFQNLAASVSNAWPKEKDGDTKKFSAAARVAQVHKEALFEAAGTSAEKRKLALDCADILHGKALHHDNVASVTAALFGTPEIAAIFAQHLPDPADREPFFSALSEAAAIHGLSDIEIPVSVLAAERRPTDYEQTHFIDQRSANSARLYEAAGLPAGQVSELIRNTRVVGEASVKRSIGAQFLDLTDRVSAMIVKPFFQNKDTGRPEMEKIFNSIANAIRNTDPEKAVHFDPALWSAFKAAAQPIADATVTRREKDLYAYA